MKNNSQNLLIAAVTLMVFFFVWDKFVVRRYAPVRPPVAASPAAPAAPDAAAIRPVDAKTPPATVPAAGSSASNDIVQPLSSRETLSTVNDEVTFESRGARVVSWRRRERDHWVEFVLPMGEVRPLETFPDLTFAIAKKSPSEAVFTADHPAGVRVRKTVTLRSDSLFNSVSVELINTGKAPVRVEGSLAWGPGLNKHEEGGKVKSDAQTAAQAESRALAWASASNLLREWQPGFIRNRTIDRVDEGPFLWAGVDNHHFLAAFVAKPESPIARIRVSANRDVPPAIGVPLLAELAPGASQTTSYDLYIGPKKHDQLKKLDLHLEETVSFGFFGVISKGLLYSLQYLKQLTGNWGWAIVILTVALQVLVFPLTRKSMQHTLRMKELQPQLKKIQEQFKSDPKRLQIETMNVYKRNGMKFMGMEGCLPILAQIPIFIALFNTLQSAYELRGAPWILWIQDLSHHDPFYVLPILMGLGMFAQQKITTVPMDPAQAKMMMFMPVLMTVMFHKLPAGLVLYWVVNSIMTILIQWMLLLKKKEPEPA